jgi:Ser/Thr protein kinase RdoA (MazF antagonist)
MIPDYVRQAYALQGPARLLPGGSVKVYRVGDLVLKQIHRTSLETPHSLELTPWLAELIAGIAEDGFRIARPVASRGGAWMLPDGWTVSTFVTGRPAGCEDIPAAIPAIRALHGMLAHAPKHPLLDKDDCPWGFAEKHCWGSRPTWVHPMLEEYVDDLYAKRRPVPPMTCQLIHGDLNPENILVAPDLTPGFIDLTPFWSPVDFALAMFANWIGPRRGDRYVLRHFEDIAHFDQLLLRAAIRMLLIVSELHGVKGWEKSSEKHAAEIVLDYVS